MQQELYIMHVGSITRQVPRTRTMRAVIQLKCSTYYIVGYFRYPVREDSNCDEFRLEY